MDRDYSRYEPLFGSWHIVEELGAGAEGSLFRICRSDALGHKYYSALKAISVPGNEAETLSLMAGGMSKEEVSEYYESVLENTTQEFELLAKLKGNSNIVSYEDHEIYRHEDDPGWDVLIRLEELTPLVKYSIDNPLSADEVARMGADICRGLSLCRKFGIVHRDIKPDNIFLSPGGSYKLGDFGIARIVEETSKSLSRKGTYTYMAPEVYWGREYGPNIDLYSLGMVMYRYLNDGRMPFLPVYPEPIKYGDEEDAFVRRVSGHQMPAPRNGSEELKRIVLKACAYDSADRYSRAEEMRKDLYALLLEEGESAAKTVRKTDGAKKPAPEKKKSGRIAAIAAAVCLMTAAAVYAVIPKEVTDIDAGAAEGSAEIYIGDELAPTYTVSPDRFRDEPVTFTSDNEEVMTADENGVLHAVSVGDAVLSMRAKEYTETSEIHVVPKVTEISGIEGTISMTAGDSITLEPVLLPEKFSDEPVTYKVKDKSVASVTEKGVLTAVSAGETKLTLSAGGCRIRSVITVSDPVVYSSSSSGSSSSKKSSGSSSKSSKSSKSSSSGKKGYFDSSDDEYF